MRTSLAVELIAEHSFEGVLDDVVSAIGFEERLYFLHQLIVKLVCIRLDCRIYGNSFISYVGLTELSCCYAATAAVF